MARHPKLGQHFLADTRYRRRIVDLLLLRPEDLVLEIGPGRGALTGLLAERARRVVALELDPILAGRLKEEWRHDQRVEVQAGDILATNIAELSAERGFESCFVFGNLPYYITSPIIHHLFRFRSAIRAMALVVQREVAERLAASPGRRDYGYLSVLAQLYWRPHLTLRLPPGAFSPPPKVHSALVSFETSSRLPGAAKRTQRVIALRQFSRSDEENFLEFVKLCFAQKRKSVLNNLDRRHSRERIASILASMALPSQARAEQLTLEQFAELYGRLG